MKLQVEKINRLADIVEACQDVTIDDHEPVSGLSFTMERENYACGAPGCILGHNAAAHGRSLLGWTAMADIAIDLGITQGQAQQLCAPEFPNADYQDTPGQPGYISAARAAACLRNLAETGQVNWITQKEVS